MPSNRLGRCYGFRFFKEYSVDINGVWVCDYYSRMWGLSGSKAEFGLVIQAMWIPLKTVMIVRKGIVLMCKCTINEAGRCDWAHYQAQWGTHQRSTTFNTIFFGTQRMGVKWRIATAFTKLSNLLCWGWNNTRQFWPYDQIRVNASSSPI